MVSVALAISKKLEKLDELGLFSKRITTIKTKEGKEIVQIGWDRTALFQQFLDRYNRPDDELAHKYIMQDKMQALKELYYLIQQELVFKNKSDLMLHEKEEPRYLKDFFKLYKWCIDMLRTLKIITPHDQHFLQPVFDNQGDFQGMKSLTEEQVARLGEQKNE